jgi:hypothetical protein
LPGSKGVIFTIVRDHLPNFIAVANTETGEVRRLMEGQVARYANSGHLLHVRVDGALMATPFDIDSLDVTGDAVPLGMYLPADERPDIALAANGRLVYGTRTEMTLEAVWVDRQGNWTPVDPDRPIRQSRYVNLSPDNRWLAVSENLSPESSNDDGQILLKQLPRGPLAPLTFTPGVNMRPAWTPDGKAIAFISDRNGKREVWIKQVQKSADAEVLLSDTTVIDEVVFSRDGDWLVYRRGKEDGQRDIFARRVGSDAEPIALAASEFDETSPALSADGRWLAYASYRSGQWNVYATPFPDGGREIRVSVDGGMQPLWAPDRPALYYVNGDGYVVAVDSEQEAAFAPGEEQVLFPAGPYLDDAFHPAFDVTNDGGRFVMIRISDSGSVEEELIVVENLFEEIAGAAASR